MKMNQVPNTQDRVPRTTRNAHDTRTTHDDTRGERGTTHDAPGHKIDHAGQGMKCVAPGTLYLTIRNVYFPGVFRKITSI